MCWDGVIELRFYDENADQAEVKLEDLDRKKTLQAFFVNHKKSRGIRPKTLIPQIEERAKKYAHSDFKEKYKDANLNDLALYDLSANRSFMSPERRMLVHIFLWTQYPAYRRAWGEFANRNDSDAA